jgi:hypothetical protein
MKPLNRKKAEFARLIALTKWSQTETAKRLGKTPGAINHMLNPSHPNTPTPSTFRLLKMIIASEKSRNIPAENRQKPSRVSKEKILQYSAAEYDLIGHLRALPPQRQKIISSAIRTILKLTCGGKPLRKRNP